MISLNLGMTNNGIHCPAETPFLPAYTQVPGRNGKEINSFCTVERTFLSLIGVVPLSILTGSSIFDHFGFKLGTGPTFDADRCLDTLLRNGYFSCACSQKSAIGDAGHGQTNIPGIQIKLPSI